MIQPLFRSILLIFSIVITTTPSRKPVDKLSRLHQVYAQLLRTMGSPADAPVLRLLPKSLARPERAVVYRPENPAVIELNEVVLDICLSFDSGADAALACLLGHELAHFQFRHGEKKGFFSPVALPANAPYSSENLEALADRAGIFLTYLAGYDAFAIAPLVYQKLYDAFKLPDQLPGYPTRTQRLRMVADTTARVQELAQLFEIGEISYLLHDYEAANQAFTALLTRYPTAVTLNNLGTIKLNLALSRMASARSDTRLCYLFPVEFDADNRLLATNRRGEPLPYQPLLTEALNLFNTALAEQPANRAAALNAAITHYLLGRPEQARQLLLMHPPISANARLMLAIIQADLSQLAEARLSFRQAREQGAFRASENSQLFDESQKQSWVRYLNSLVVRRQRRQTGIKPMRNWPTIPALNVNRQSLPLLGIIRYARTNGFTTYELPLEENGKKRRFQIIRSSQIPLPGLPFGSPHSRLSGYESPASVIAGARNGTFYEYRRGPERLFLTYQADKLVCWTYATY